MNNSKYALVTGSTKGIGKQIAIDLLKKDYFVILNYSSDDSVITDLEIELSEISSKYKIIKQDLSDMDGIPSFITNVKNVAPYLNVLVLNTAITNRKDFKELSMEDWNKVLNTNLTGPFFIVQSLSDYILNDGNIIFIGALMGIYPHAMSIPYGVSKAAVHELSKYLVKYFCERSITVNTVAPGFVETPWQKNKPEQIRKNITEKTALKRFAMPSEVSSTCLHLIENRFVNGQIIVIDGGYCYK